MKRVLLFVVAMLTAVQSFSQVCELRYGDGGMGLYDPRTGKWQVAPEYNYGRYIGSYQGVDYFAMQTYNNLWGIIASNNFKYFKVAPKFSKIETWYPDRFASIPIIFVESGGSWGIMEVYTSKTFYILAGKNCQYAGCNYDDSVYTISWDDKRTTYSFTEIKQAFDKAVSMEKEMQAASLRLAEEKKKQEEEKQARLKKEAELASFTEYAKNRITPMINEWQKKGEFEKLADYQSRVTGANRLAKIDEYTKEAEASFIAEHAALDPVAKMTLGLYDSENEVFSITSEKFGQLLLPVPIDDGRAFKENFSSVRKENPQYFIEDDKLALRSLTFVNTVNGKSYVYSNSAALNYSQYEINADDLDIESVSITPTQTFTGGRAVKPTCEILVPQNGDTYTTGTIVIKYRTTVADGLVPEISVSVNGRDVEVKDRGETTSKGVRLAAAQEAEIEVPRDSESDCIITMMVKDSQGTLGEPKKVKVRYVGDKPKPALHLFAVGISEYPSKDLETLSYAAKDAKDFINAVTSADTEMYSQVTPQLLLNSKATSAAVKGALNALKNDVEQGDVVMVFFSGHGVKENDEAYFMSYDASAKEYYNGVEFDFIKKRLNAMAQEKKCRVVLFLDACHSGAMYGMKGVTRAFSETAPDIVGFYSSTEAQQSAEKKQIENGVFTHALIMGLKGGAVNEEGEVTLNGLDRYVKEKVRAETAGRQDPIVENRVGDAVLFKVK